MELQSILEKTNFSFEIIRHEKIIRSAQDGARFFGIEIGQTAPTLIVKTEQGFFALILSGKRGRVDFAEVSGILGCKQVEMATSKEVLQVTGCTVGNVPMLGLGIPCVVDKQLFEYQVIYGGTGDPNSTLKISPAALTELNNIVAVWE